MNRISFSSAILLIFLCCSNLCAQVLIPTEPASSKLSLNGQWKFKLWPANDIGSDSLFYKPTTDVSKWSNIRVPGQWELQGFAEPIYGKEEKPGIGLYRTTFITPIGWKHNPVYIAFDGVLFGYTFWVNGHYAGTFASSFNRQTFELSKFVLPGKANVLAVKVSRLPKGWEFDTFDCWSLAGIFRNVTLFSLPDVHVKDFVARTDVKANAVTIALKTIIEKAAGTRSANNINLTAQLINPSGKLIKTVALTGPGLSGIADTAIYVQRFDILKPLLWTAETPYLYTVRLLVKQGQTLVQQYTEHIGIRQITWTNGILKLNGSPIKLRGVDHHDLSPINGRAITDAELKKDLKLAQEANINFIRTSHYPPNPRLLEMCDSLGIYILDEVCIGAGENHLEDTSYLPLLLTRARATVWRDKNHPSIITWSIGNENPLTPICEDAGRLVKQLDGTRPICYPQLGSVLNKLTPAQRELEDVFSPHYPSNKELKADASKFNHPVIVTEYAHSFGLDFDRMEEQWEIMYANPRLAGGAVWCLFDQGLLRKSANPIGKNEPTDYAWIDSVTYYDTGGIQGVDGLVYANRLPQVDYWQARKVYTPVKALGDTISYIRDSKQNLKFKLNNRFDFTNLSAIKCKWQLFADTAMISSGIAPLNCKPHDSTTVAIAAVLPEISSSHYYHLKLYFINQKNYQFCEKVYAIKAINTPNLKQQLAIKIAEPVITAGKITAEDYSFEYSSTSGEIKLKNKKGALIIADGPFARVGRKPTMAIKGKKINSFILNKPESKVELSNGHELVLDYNYKASKPKEPSLSGYVKYNFSDSGYIDIKYHLTPDTTKAPALEAGISMLLPLNITEFRWVGKGLYAGYPGKSVLNEFGFYHLTSSDIYYQGNREDVDCALFTDSKGNGFALLANKANIAVERTADGILVSHNAIVSGRFNKGSFPETLYEFQNIKEISGAFTIVPLTQQWPLVLQRLFGKPNKSVVPYQPFYNSYDQ